MISFVVSQDFTTVIIFDVFLGADWIVLENSVAICNDGDDWFRSVKVLNFVNCFICDHCIGLSVARMHLS